MVKKKIKKDSKNKKSMGLSFKRKYFSKKIFILDDDIIPYIVPKISTKTKYGNKINFYEGGDAFL